MPLYQTSVLKEYIIAQDTIVIEKAYKKFIKYFHNPTIQKNIRESKEEQFQEGFLRELFVTIFGYSLNPQPNFNLTTEFKNEKGAKKADGAILSRGHDPLAKPFALAVIELKSTKTKDLESIRQQAFDYKANQTGCVYVITSNFEKLRFYINNAVEFEEFNLFTLTLSQFELLYLCLHQSNLLDNIPLKINEASIVKEEKITKEFYTDYSLFKRALFRDLVKNNLKNEVFRAELNKEDSEQAVKNIKLTLFKKSQKLIDRFLFVFFAEDRDLLPSNSTLQILNKWKEDIDYGDARPLYAMFKLYFHFLDTGRRKTEKRAEIFAYNGGLFKPDAVLDSLLISDDLLHDHTKKLSTYNFSSDVGVNILGHIFENSLNEIESVNAEIEGVTFDKQKTKRKKDGVFYTPKYITKYIVDNTVGKLCSEKKTELNIVEEEFHSKRKKGTKKKLLTALETYRAWLLQLTILDPACGSGAFLNQALDFLIKEHGYIDELQTNLLGGGFVFPNIENTVLENNIFGVDLNEESVEIAKLSLWLRTAQPRRKLNDLSSNIKCGNSLIDSKAVAGDKAFKWEKEFPNIFKEKEKKAFHITTALHDSRTSARMEKYKVRERRAMGTNPYPSNVNLTKEDDLLITKTIATIVAEDNLNVLAYNTCGDHIHLLLVCDGDDVSKIVGKLKAITSKEYNIEAGITIRGHGVTTEGHSVTARDGVTARGHVPLSKEGKKTYNSLWTQKFGCKEVTTERQLQNTIDYITKNRGKHKLPQHSRKLNDMIDEMCCDFNTAFGVAYQGGFDVVIGNPPYVRQELLGDFKPFFEDNFKVFEGASDLFAYFYEKSFNLLKNEKGIFGFISNTFDKTKAGKKLREYLSGQVSFEKYIDFTEVQVFEGATTYPIILIAKNTPTSNGIFQYAKVSKELQNKVIDIDLIKPVKVAQKTLNSESWNFYSIEGSKILEKVLKHKTLREQFGKSFRGIVTGFNDAFIIDNSIKQRLEKEHISSKELIKPFFEGKDQSKWHSCDIDKYIIFTRRGTEIEKFPAIKEYLEINKERLTPRNSPEIKVGRKPGPYKWFEIQDSVDYYKVFESPKITWPNLQSTNKFSIDVNGYYINAPSVVFPIANKTLLCILNSKITWFFLKSICVVRSGGYIEVKPQYFEQIPIPELKNVELFEEKADEIIENTTKIQGVQSKFTNYLQSQFTIEKLPKKLQNWHELDFGEFIKELNKAVKKRNREVATDTTRGHVPLSEQLVKPLTKLQEMEWMEVFEIKKAEALTLKAEIDKTDTEIDSMVYELYGLSEEEIEIVEQS